MEKTNNRNIKTYILISIFVAMIAISNICSRRLSASTIKLKEEQNASIYSLEKEYQQYDKYMSLYRQSLHIRLWLAKNHLIWRKKIPLSIFLHQIILLAKSFSCDYQGGGVDHNTLETSPPNNIGHTIYRAHPDYSQIIALHYQIMGNTKNLLGFLKSFIFLVSEQRIINIQMHSIDENYTKTEYKKSNHNKINTKMILNVNAYLFGS